MFLDFLFGISKTLERIEGKLDALIKEVRMAVPTLDDIQAKVTAEGTVEQGAITLLQGLSAQIAALKQDPAKLQALADSLDQQSQALAAAVTANTPAANASKK